MSVHTNSNPIQGEARVSAAAMWQRYAVATAAHRLVGRAAEAKPLAVSFSTHTERSNDAVLNELVEQMHRPGIS
jgi:hypothetical protein